MIEIESKIQKIVTALYLVSDLIEEHDPLRKDIRQSGVRLSSLVAELAIENPSQAKKTITEAQSYIDRIHNVLKVCVSVGFVSDMNFKIISEHLTRVKDDLNTKYGLINSQSLAASSFHNKAIHEFVLPDFITQEVPLHQTPQTVAQSKKTPQEKMTQSSVQKDKEKRPEESKVSDNISFGQRAEKILAIVQEKGEVSVSDVSIQFPELSEKTMQRMLIRLVEMGSLHKTGEKRWSRYSLAQSS